MKAHDCREVTELLSDPSACGGSDVRGHLETCEECRRSATALDALVQTRPEPDPVKLTGFAARVASRSPQRSLRRPLAWGALATTTALAAALFLARPAPLTPDSPPAVAASSDAVLGDWSDEMVEEWLLESDQVGAVAALDTLLEESEDALF